MTYTKLLLIITFLVSCSSTREFKIEDEVSINSNYILMEGAISNFQEKQIYSQLKNKETNIYILITSSPGGPITKLYSILDAIQVAKDAGKNIICAVTNFAASGAFYTLNSCDVRIVFPDTILLFHGTQRNNTIRNGMEAKTYLEKSTYLDNYLMKLLTDTGMDRDFVSSEFYTDKHFYATDLTAYVPSDYFVFTRKLVILERKDLLLEDNK